MKRKFFVVGCLLPALCGTACSSLLQPDDSVSEAVIESMLPSQQEQPWRLDTAWQNSGLAGSVLRAASVEHVVRQIDQPVAFQAIDASTLNLAMNIGMSPLPDEQNGDPLVIERAWRKYCHHQLDMTAEEQALVRFLPIPRDVLNHGCNPGSLNK